MGRKGADGEFDAAKLALADDAAQAFRGLVREEEPAFSITPGFDFVLGPGWAVARGCTTSSQASDGSVVGPS